MMAVCMYTVREASRAYFVQSTFDGMTIDNEHIAMCYGMSQSVIS